MSNDKGPEPKERRDILNDFYTTFRRYLILRGLATYSLDEGNPEAPSEEKTTKESEENL